MKLLKFIFGCKHKQTTWPQGRAEDCHVNCIACGKRIPYDWELMKRVT